MLAILEMTYPFAPLSQNHLEKSRPDGRRYKTRQARQYQMMIKAVTSQYSKEIANFKSFVNDETTLLTLDYTFYLHQEKMFTKGKKRRLKKTCGDCFNFEKYTTDCIFKALGLDDYLVNFGSVARLPSLDNPNFHVVLKAQHIYDIAEFGKFL